ncbi:signal peptide protein, YSIRK family [Sesbania bispinosa]|nr:signal peptide protein, YSIRK family [Sesbania bispinosa]
MGTLQLLDPSWLHQPHPPEKGKRGHRGLYAVHGCPVRERRRKNRVLWAHRRQSFPVGTKIQALKKKESQEATNPSFKH